MSRFLIEVPHGDSEFSCKKAIRVFQETGSHFLSKAEWGCMDGVHKAWIIVDVDSKDEARYIIPPLYRSDAKIVQLVTFANKSLRKPGKYHAV